MAVALYNFLNSNTYETTSNPCIWGHYILRN